MRDFELRRWLIESAEEDSWWLSLNGEVYDLTYALSEISEIALDFFDQDLRIRHVSVTDISGKSEWVKYEPEIKARATRRLGVKKDPKAKLTFFEKKQQQRLLELHDHIMEGMYGIQKDTICDAAEGSEATGSRMHQGDDGSDAYDRDFALCMLSQEDNALGEIEKALQHLELGTYGICEESGKKIPQPRLEALPFALSTVEFKAAKERESLPPKPQNFHNSATQPISVNDIQGIKSESNVNRSRKNKKEALHDDETVATNQPDHYDALTLNDDTSLGISSDMPTEEIRTHLNKLFRKYSSRISHDDPKIAAESREALKKIGEARARHIGVY